MERIVLSFNSEARAMIKAIEADSRTKSSLCYQCGKCTAGCPIAFAMDYPPRQIIRFLQLGLINSALGAKSIWLCATCETCSTRCPRGVDIAAVMDALRREAGNRGIETDKDVAMFNLAFLNSVKRFGRLHEASMVVEHNLRTMKPMKDMDLVPSMLVRGKAKMLPDLIKGQKTVKRIFKRVKELGGGLE
ncbi:MAG: 4Fe-4S dicluster domain-containing protein [Chitinophagales bacterium]